jgi:hypothetical protein
MCLSERGIIVERGGEGGQVSTLGFLAATESGPSTAAECPSDECRGHIEKTALVDLHIGRTAPLPRADGPVAAAACSKEELAGKRTSLEAVLAARASTAFSSFGCRKLASRGDREVKLIALDHSDPVQPNREVKA